MGCQRRISILSVCFVLMYLIAESAKSKVNLIQNISDPKEFKQFMRTHTNVLVLFAKSEKELTVSQWNMLAEVALKMKGVASIVFVDCSADSKPCKKLKSSPSSFELKHYKDGVFHKLYDRMLTVKSMCNFLSNPTGEIPWEEDSEAGDVFHANSREELMRVLEKEKKPTLVMFYAPWCGHCKRLKPEFASAATELKGSAILVGMDVDKPDNYVVRTEYNVTGFPTLCYFENGQFIFRYGGENNKDGIIKWMQSPSAPVEAPKEQEWSEVESDVVHLTDATFDEHINSVPSVLVMFYAPWCGHCKKMKPEFEQAAAQMKSEEIVGSLAAVDATKEQKAGKKFEIKGYPTVKYFKNGKYMWEVSERTADKIVEFMKDPKEPVAPPAEDTPWESIPSQVVHLDDELFRPFTKKKKHVLVMFYAPWCGHCKKAKPEFMSAAEHFSDTKVSFAAVDCTKHAALCQSYDVSGYPTFIYYNYGKNDIKYTGGRERDDFVRFMNDPLSPLSLSPSKPSAEEQWMEVDSTKNVYHLTERSFDSVLRQQKSALVLFYAPWCGHCKAMKPAYAEAAATLKANKIDGILAAVDATAEKGLQERFSIEGFPTLKYFSNGVETLTYKLGRRAEDLVSFMKNQLEAGAPNRLGRVTSPNELNEFVTSHDRCLVIFCSSCESLIASLQTAVVGRLDALPISWNLATVDCSEQSTLDLCSNIDANILPVFRYFKNGNYISDSTGNVSADDVMSFIESEKAPKVEL